MGTDAPMLEQLRKAHTRSPALMPLGETLGFRVERLEAGWAVVAMETSDRHANVLGATHGGVIFALADTAMGLAHLGLLAQGQGGTTVEMLLADLDRKDFAYLSTTPFPWARHPSIRILWIPARE